jgi:cytochrome c-type biogenesis protein CcsB
VTDEALAQLSNHLVYSAIAVYTCALIAYAVDLSGFGAGARRVAGSADRLAVAAGSGGGAVDVRVPEVPAAQAAPPSRRKAAGIAVSLTWLAFLLHASGVAARGLAAGRVPWGNMYEFTVTGAMVVTGVYLIVLLRHDARWLGAFVVGPVLLALGLAVTVLYTEAAQLVPALHSYWLMIHVSVAFIATALFTLGFSITVIQLVQDRRETRRAAGRPARRGRFMDRLPPAVELERLAYRLHVVAFPLWTFAVIAGAIWAQAAWGRYWNWDPKEVWSFVVWVVYAGYLHARATRGWYGRRAAYLALAGYACVLFNFGVVNVALVGWHSYAGIG